MSSVGDSFTGDTSGTTDTSGLDVNSLFGNLPSDAFDASSTDTSGLTGDGGFNSFSSIANALSSGTPIGASPTVAQSASMSPAAAAAPGSDPTGAASGTQSSTTPGQTPANSNQPSQGGGGQNQQQQNPYAPPAAVNQLKQLLKGLSGQPTGPTGQAPAAPGQQPFALPTLARGQTGPQSPQMALPALAAGQTGPQSPLAALAGTQPAAASIPPGAASQPTAAAGGGGGTPATNAQGEPITAAGTPASQTPTPPPRPGGAAAPTQAAPEGRQITVQPRAAGGMPAPQNEPGEVAPGGPALPTRKPTKPTTAAAPAPTGAGATPRILQDITGASTGSPTALADLAQAAQIILPLVAGLMGGGRRGRFGRFHGGRFTHGVGGFGHLHQGQHPAGRGAWPYHHPQFGWHFHGRPPGPGWAPLNPTDAQSMLGGGAQPGQNQQDPNALDPNAPPKETGRDPGTPDQVGSSGAIPGVSAKQVDDYTRQVAQEYNIDPDVASRVLAQESSYGQAKKPGDDGTSFGPFQLHFAPDGKAMGDDFLRDTGRDPRDPSTWKEQIDYALQHAATGGWGPWTTTMKKLGMNEWTGINRTFKGARMSSTEPQNLAPAAAMTTGLPVTSQPMVAGP
jgi:hypothetical protein